MHIPKARVFGDENIFSFSLCDPQVQSVSLNQCYELVKKFKLINGN